MKTIILLFFIVLISGCSSTYNKEEAIPARIRYTLSYYRNIDTVKLNVMPVVRFSNDTIISIDGDLYILRKYKQENEK